MNVMFDKFRALFQIYNRLWITKFRFASAKNRLTEKAQLRINVRCNLFHGQKHLYLHQLPLMRAVIPILELLVSNTEEKNCELE